MKNIFLLSLLLVMSCKVLAQKQTFDVVSFAFPKGWQQQKSEAGIQLSITDKKTGIYGIAVITKARASSASANENFNNDWDKLVKRAVIADTAPSISDMSIETGWSCVTGQANYIDGNNKGLATLITATGYGQTTSVIIMTNGSKYQENILAFVNSLELSKPLQNTEGSSSPSGKTSSAQTSNITAGYAINSPLAGKIWEGRSLEKAGTGNMQYYTGGYFTSQYAFNADGTYRFVNVNASAFSNSKTLNYETGTWLVSGNQLTIMPAKGQDEEWSIIGKTSNGNSDVDNRKIMDRWNKKIKTSGRKLEKYTYSFNIGKNGDKNALILQRSGRTEREGEGRISYYNETLPVQSVILPAGIN